MTAVTVSFRWLDILEKEFDKAFVDLDLIVGDLSEYYDCEEYRKAQTRLHALSSCFAQLTHKAQTIFQSNAKLEAELVHLRGETAESQARLKLSQQQQQRLKDKLELFQPDAAAGADEDEQTKEEVIQLQQEWHGASEELSTSQQRVLITASEAAATDQLKRENAALRRLLLGMQGELCGARLAAKYLDKELAGRIQQLQLLGREVRWQQEHDKLWRQLEAEINLHRHKTVVRACRANIPAHNGMQTACEPPSVDGCPLLPVSATDDDPRPDPSRYSRTVTITKSRGQSLGMSVTGGREHGVPIVVSVVHPDTPASQCGDLFVGDAILSVDGQDLTQMSHTEAVALLSRPAQTVILELMFVPPEDEETSSLADDPFAFKYRLFDDDVLSVASSAVACVPVRRQMPVPSDVDGRLSRASLDSIRGSADNLDTQSDGPSDSHSNCGSVVSGEGARLGDRPSMSTANSQHETQESVTQSFSKEPSPSALEKQRLENHVHLEDTLPFSASYPGTTNAYTPSAERYSAAQTDTRLHSYAQQQTPPASSAQDNVTEPRDLSSRRTLSISSRKSDGTPTNQHPTLRSYSCAPVSASQDPPTPVHRRSVPCYPGIASPVPLAVGRGDAVHNSPSLVGGGAAVGQVSNGLTDEVVTGSRATNRAHSDSYKGSSQDDASDALLPKNRSSHGNKSGIKKTSSPLLQTPLQEIEQQMTTALPGAEDSPNSIISTASATASPPSSTRRTEAHDAALFNGNY